MSSSIQIVDEKLVDISSLQVQEVGSQWFCEIRQARSKAVPHKNQGGQASTTESGSSPSRVPKDKPSCAITGRRAKRAMKREAANKAANKAAEAVAAAKHEAHLVRLGRK